LPWSGVGKICRMLGSFLLVAGLLARGVDASAVEHEPYEPMKGSVHADLTLVAPSRLSQRTKAQSSEECERKCAGWERRCVAWSFRESDAQCVLVTSEGIHAAENNIFAPKRGWVTSFTASMSGFRPKNLAAKLPCRAEDELCACREGSEGFSQCSSVELEIGTDANEDVHPWASDSRFTIQPSPQCGAGRCSPTHTCCVVDEMEVCYEGACP
jgi:hypothetical protein